MSSVAIRPTRGRFSGWRSGLELRLKSAVGHTPDRQQNEERKQLAPDGSGDDREQYTDHGQEPGEGQDATGRGAVALDPRVESHRQYAQEREADDREEEDVHAPEDQVLRGHLEDARIGAERPRLGLAPYPAEVEQKRRGEGDW